MRVLLKIKALTLVLALGFPKNGFAQTLEGSTRTIGMGGAGTALATNVHSNLNPASLGGLAGTTVAFSGAQGFGLSELRTVSAAAAVHTSFANVGIQAQAFGFDAYREMKFGAGLGKGITFGSSRNVILGVLAQYQQVSIPNHGNAGALGVSVGMQTRMTNRVSIGMQATNVNRPNYTENEDLARSIRAGVAYSSDNLLLLLDVEKDVRFPVSVQSGFEFKPVSALSIRAGIGTAPVRYSAGVGFSMSKIKADIAVQRHQLLGWSPALTLEVGL